MKLSKILAIAAVALCFGATQATAGIVNVSANLTASIGVGSVVVTGSAVGVSSIGGGQAPVPAIGPISLSTPISPPQFGLNKVTVSGGSFGPGTLTPPGGLLGLNATANIFAGANPAGNVPLSPIGGGGSSTGLLLGIFKATLNGNGWTTGATTVTGTGLASGTAMATGFDNRTAGGVGTVVFVSGATVVLTAIPVTIPAVSVLTLVYTAAATPEPGTLLLLGGGIAGLVALGRSRARK